MRLGPVCALSLSVALAHCTCAPTLPHVTVHAPAEVPAGLKIAADDLAADLERAHAGTPSRAATDAHCVDGEVHLQVAGVDTTLGSQEYEIADKSCGSGHLVTMRGGSLLAAQWAVYDVLQQVGVRYFHPEQTLYPAQFQWPASLDARRKPALWRRSMHAHRTHPIELSAPKDASGVDMAAFQRRWIDWNVKMRQTIVDGWDAEYVGTYAFDRGFTREEGFALLNSQQGMKPVLNPDDPRPEEQQIADAIEERIAAKDGVPAAGAFNFQFNPSEFTEADDQDTVRRLTTIADYMRQKHPEIELTTINHGTAGEPTAHYGVRFFDLPQFAPANLGVQVHTLMFYDLERPAPVYGNTDFHHMLDWMRDQAKHRRITHYPESSWWLTFDLPVPLFLAPVTLEARQHDISLLRDLASADPSKNEGFVGHHLFTSGQEWGYWLIDYCVAQMDWDLTTTNAACLDDVTSQFAFGADIRQVLREVEQRQITDLRDPELLRFLVGSDDATETAFDAGIVFHPLPPRPAEVLAWDDQQVAKLQTDSLQKLRAMAADYRAWADRVVRTLHAQSPAQAPWVREIHDGLAVFALRADHAAEVYETALALRAALAKNDLNGIQTAYEGVTRAKALTEQARAIVQAREADYRYPPALTIAGGEPGTPEAVENQTVYPYRYLSRTHRLFYWERPDKQLAALFGEGIDAVKVKRRVVRQGVPFEVSLLSQASDLRIDWGDGQSAAELAPHTYAKQGFFDWTLDARTATAAVHWPDEVAIALRRVVFPRKSLHVQEPSGAAILDGLLPGFEVGLGDDGKQFLALGRIDDVEAVAARGSLQRRERTGNASVPGDLAVNLHNVGDVTVRDAVIEVQDGTGPDARVLDVHGRMRTGEVIDLLVKVGGFEREGATKLVADILGETPDTLPDEIPFELSGKGKEAD